MTIEEKLVLIEKNIDEIKLELKKNNEIGSELDKLKIHVEYIKKTLSDHNGVISNINKNITDVITGQIKITGQVENSKAIFDAENNWQVWAIRLIVGAVIGGVIAILSKAIK